MVEGFVDGTRGVVGMIYPRILLGLLLERSAVPREVSTQKMSCRSQ